MLRLRSPMRVQMEITNACNNACVHCYNYWRYLTTGEMLNADDHSRSLEHFMAILEMIISEGLTTVTFTGGEPFLRRDVLFPLVERAKQAGLQVFINTNAALMRADDVQKAKELGVDGFLVSLLSYDEDTHNSMVTANSHAKTLQGIRLLAEAGQAFSVNMVTSSKNWHQVRKTAQAAQAAGAYAFSATPVLSCYLAEEHESIMLKPEELKQTLHDLIWVEKNLDMSIAVLEPIAHCAFTEEERNLFYPLLGARYCCAGISDCAISVDGEMRPCILSSEIGGNVLTDGWRESWDNLSKWKAPEMLPHRCLECAEVDFCGGGCRAASLAKHGEITGEDPFMTEPLLTLSDNAHGNQPDLPQVADDQLLIPHPYIKTRDEEFGGTIAVEGKYMFVTSDALGFVRCLIEEQEFDVNGLVNKYQADRDDLRGFLSILKNNGFLQKKRGGEVSVRTVA